MVKKVGEVSMRALLSLLFVIGLAGIMACSAEQTTGPEEVRWDRETCTRCNMSVGDRNYVAQVRGGPPGEKTKVYKFDDIGCAVIWLQDKEWKDDARTEIWVTDFTNGQWVDARKARYVPGKLTPMNYGLGAQAEATADALDFAQAIEHIMISEKEKHQHGGHHHH